MRTISIRLDGHTKQSLTDYCKRHGLSQTDALKAAIKHLAQTHRAKPAELAAQFGLIGGFSSAQGDLAQNHSMRVKERLREKLTRDSLPAPALPKAPRRSAAR